MKSRQKVVKAQQRIVLKRLFSSPIVVSCITAVITVVVTQLLQKELNKAPAPISKQVASKGLLTPDDVLEQQVRVRMRDFGEESRVLILSHHLENRKNSLISDRLLVLDVDDGDIRKGFSFTPIDKENLSFNVIGSGDFDLNGQNETLIGVSRCGINCVFGAMILKWDPVREKYVLKSVLGKPKLTAPRGKYGRFITKFYSRAGTLHGKEQKLKLYYSDSVRLLGHNRLITTYIVSARSHGGTRTLELKRWPLVTGRKYRVTTTDLGCWDDKHVLYKLGPNRTQQSLNDGIKKTSEKSRTQLCP